MLSVTTGHIGEDAIMSTATHRGADPLQGLTLPSIPESLQRIRAEQAKTEPDVGRITGIIAGDAGLAAEVLRTINSPLFRRRQPMSSIPNAVMLLGLPNVLNIAAGVAVRAALMRCPSGQPAFPRFWDTASDVALACAALAREISGIPADTAYTLGLFHDCGIPVLICHLRGYGDFIRGAERTEQRITELELDNFEVNHAVVGAQVSRHWHLPPAICEAIRLHHEYDRISAPGSGADEQLVTLVGLLKLAERICANYRGMGFGSSAAEEFEWNAAGPRVLRHFDLSESLYADLSDDITEMLSAR